LSQKNVESKVSIDEIMVACDRSFAGALKSDSSEKLSPIASQWLENRKLPRYHLLCGKGALKFDYIIGANGKDGNAKNSSINFVSSTMASEEQVKCLENEKIKLVKEDKFHTCDQAKWTAKAKYSFEIGKEEKPLSSQRVD